MAAKNNAPYGYDPMTGEPLSAPSGGGNSAPYGYDPMTGEPLRSPSGGGNSAPYGYDPMTGEPRTAPEGKRESASGTAAPARKGAGPVILIGAAAVVVVLVLIFAVIRPFAGGSVKLSEDEAMAGTIEAIQDRNGITAFLRTLSESEEPVEIKISAEDMTDLLAEEGLDRDTAELIDPAFSADLVVDAVDLEASADLTLSMLGMDLTAGIYVSEEEIEVSVPGILQDSYMIDTTNIMKDLSRSIFNPDNGSYYALGSSDYQSLAALADMLDELFAAASFIGEDQVEAYYDALEDADLMPVFKSKSGSAEVGGSKVSCKVRTLSMDAEELSEFLFFTLDYLEEAVDSSVWFQLDEDAKDQTLYVIEAFREGLESDLDDDLCLDLEYDVKDSQVIRIDAVFYSSDDDSVYGEVVVDFGAAPETTEEITLTLISEEEDYYRCTLTFEESGSSEEILLEEEYGEIYNNGSEEVYDAYDVQTSLTAVWYSSDGYFSVESDDARISGTALLEDDTLILTDLEVVSGYEEADVGLLTFEISGGGSVREPDEDAVNLLTLDDDDMEEIVEQFSDWAQEMYYSLYDMMY